MSTKYSKTVSIDERLNTLLDQARLELGLGYSDIINRVMLKCLSRVIEAPYEERVKLLVDHMREKAV